MGQLHPEANGLVARQIVELGAKTRVDVEGEFHMQGMDDASTHKAALGFLAQVFDEDNAALKKYK